MYTYYYVDMCVFLSAILYCVGFFCLQHQLQCELDKISQRIEDLRKLIVTSPEKLKAVGLKCSVYVHACVHY